MRVGAGSYNPLMPPFRIAADFEPSGDQPEAIRELTEGVKAGEQYLTLLGATGTGKTFTIAHVVEAVQRPTLVIAPNKSLGAQLANEFREVFPDNAVEYFVSYYDYYQPEAYIPTTDTYIEKDSSVNDEIERLRHAATAALLSPARRPHRGERLVHLRPGLARGVRGADPASLSREPRSRSSSRCSGWSTSSTSGTRSAARAGRSASPATRSRCSRRTSRSARGSSGGATPIQRVTQFDPLTGEIVGELTETTIFPASHYVASDDRMKRALRHDRGGAASSGSPS